MRLIAEGLGFSRAEVERRKLPQGLSLLKPVRTSRPATHKRRLMVAADLARALVLLSLPATYLAGAVTLGQLYAVALLTGTAAVLFNTSYSAFFAHLVPRASYVDANSRLSTSRSASYVAGPAPIAIAALAGGPLWVRGGALALAEFLAGIGVMFFDINLNSLQAAVIHDPPPHRRTGGPE